jgi:hypothetical protein
MTAQEGARRAGGGGAEHDSAGGERGRRRVGSGERGNLGAEVGSVTGGKGARAARRLIWSGRHLMRREMRLLVPFRWVKGN